MTYSQESARGRRAATSCRDVSVFGERDFLMKPFSECTNYEIGRCGEDLACAYLESCGMEVLERNWTCAFGEADIIAEDNGVIVLVEVKTRVCCERDDVAPELAVNYRKRHRYEKLALVYLSKQTRIDNVRFDVVAVRMVGARKALLRHLLGAYEWEM